MAAIELRELHKSYGTHVALRGISFTVDEGEVVGFLGPNGAGKSTAMKILTGYLAPSNGQAFIHGTDVLADPITAQRKIGYLPENAPIYSDMRVHDYLDYIGRLRELGRAERSRAIERVARQCAITDRLQQSVSELSKGYRQRVGLAQALLHSPSILILDEPTTGLDPNQIVEIRNLIREIGRQKTVILSTHILSEVQATCDRVVIIHRGTLVADGATDDVITRTQGGLLLQVSYAPGTVAPPRETVETLLGQLEGVERVLPQREADPSLFSYEILARTDVRADLFRLAVDQGLVLLELSREKTDLEEVFRRLTASAAQK
ncbi:MAG: ATP-binding cassette domain-containing protein [Myxococcota bacterium]